MCFYAAEPDYIFKNTANTGVNAGIIHYYNVVFADSL